MGVASAQGEVVTSSGIAIVVHKDADVENLSLDELRSIFLAEKQFWQDRRRITLLVRAPQSDERDFVLNNIYQMSEAQFRQYWIAKMFRAEVPRGPKIVFSTDMTLELVVAIPGSISFIRFEDTYPLPGSITRWDRMAFSFGGWAGSIRVIAHLTEPSCSRQPGPACSCGPGHTTSSSLA